MFTGIVADIGIVDRVENDAAGRVISVRCAYDDLVPGDSVALNGACLTVREARPNWFSVAAVDTTLGRTTIAQWAPGTRVNLERAMRLGDRLGGHLVLGHVDGTGRVTAVRRAGTALLVDIAPEDDEFLPLLVPHGSVTVDGVSLTVNELGGAVSFQVSLVDYTERHTTLGELHPGDRVHLEGDVVGKYVRRLLEPYSADRGPVA